MPGSTLPSNSSREAPPPVEMCVILSAKPSCCTAAALSLSANVPPRKLDVDTLQRTLDDHGCNIGQSFRDVPALGGHPKSRFTDKFRHMNG